MTREQAIVRLRLLGKYCDVDDCFHADCYKCYRAIDKAINVLEQEPTAEYSSDVISRQMAIDALDTVGYDFSDSELSEIELEEVCEAVGDVRQDMINRIKRMTSAQPEQRWIPFTTRPLTEEEKEMYSEWDSILDCKLPDDGQRILVSVSVHGHECVQYDEFYTDDGCYLDSGYEIGTEVVAWMPLPEPYKESEE